MTPQSWICPMDVLLLKITSLVSCFLTHFFFIVSILGVPSRQIKDIRFSALPVRFSLQKKLSKADEEFCSVENLLVSHRFSILKFSIFEIDSIGTRRRNTYCHPINKNWATPFHLIFLCNDFTLH